MKKILTVISGGIPVETTDEISVAMYVGISEKKKCLTYLRTTSYREFCRNLWHIFWKNYGIKPVEVLDAKLEYMSEESSVRIPGGLTGEVCGGASGVKFLKKFLKESYKKFL